MADDRGDRTDRVRAGIAIVLLVAMLAFLRAAWTDAGMAESVPWAAVISACVFVGLWLVSRRR